MYLLGSNLYIHSEMNHHIASCWNWMHIYMNFILRRSCDSGSLNATLAKGKAILCFQSHSQRSATVAIRTVMEVQASGLIFAQFPTKDVALSWSIPYVQVDFVTGTSILSYMEATRLVFWNVSKLDSSYPIYSVLFDIL